ncbi:hypothetical protein BKA61DRAFT_150212 [Leptodontidium sp. MPI-SDFR-AT-0119]|nr:hypothetical protein BKA61DRAFT_150212 [Leptodontidium sp. MPI-SDFR-AT-0119]
MAKRGLRLLSLDGGGTRGLSVLYTLREIMNAVVPGNGGSLRPCEYFELIGGTGLNGLSALMFSRFCYTIDEAIDFFHNLSKQLDDVVSFREKILRGEVEKDLQDWVECMSEYNDPDEQLEALRQGMVQDRWSELIEKNVSDGLDRYEFMANGKFDFKRILAQVEAGRSKAFVVSSESQGYGGNGGVSEDRQYHVPTFHRTYECRHGRSTYTLYAVGLGTVACPNIMKPGVIFPDFLATGAHSQHNPVILVLEECRKLWPGIPVSTLTSIGTGKFDIERSYLEPVLEETAKSCLQIIERNKDQHDRIEQFILPFDNEIRGAYFRFDSPYSNTFFEHAQRDRILGDIRSWTEAPKSGTKIAMLSKILQVNHFPDSPEDMIALGSLASLLRSLNISGYSQEGLVISDVLANYLIYESGTKGDGSFRKLCLAAKVEALSSQIMGRHTIYVQGVSGSVPVDMRSEATVLNGLGAFGDELPGGYRIPGPLQTIYDYVSATYYCLTLLRERDASQWDQPTFSMHFEELSFIYGLPGASNSAVVELAEDLLRLTTVAALCDAANGQLLRGVKSLAYNGSFIRHLHQLLITITINKNSDLIIDPIATFLALLIETNNWSPTRDGAILALLKVGSSGDNNWSLVNLALARLQMESTRGLSTPDSKNLVAKCVEILRLHCEVWRTKAMDMIVTCPEKGWFPLLKKVFCLQDLISDAHISESSDFSSRAEMALRSTAQIGYPFVLKTMLECLGIDFCKHLVNQPDKHGLTSMHLACKHRAPQKIFRLLQILLSDVNVKSNAGRTPLSYCFPDQKALPSLHQSMLDLISEFSLPTIAPLDMPKAYGGHGNCRSIDPRTGDFRVIISHLVGRNADISIQDHNGMTPLHIAAKEGWGDNLDVPFMYTHGDTRSQQTQALTSRDHDNHTILDYSRMAGNRGPIQGREEVVVAEMAKRNIPVPPKAMHTVPVHDMYLTMPVDRPRLPTPEPPPRKPLYSPPSTAESRPVSTPSPQPSAPRFPPAMVYQDPSIGSSQNLKTPSPRPTFPSSQVYQDPKLAPSGKQTTNCQPQ